jgi:polysaccharide biosynthesis protein PslH
MGKAVVSTSVGAEGLAVRSGENILLADAPNDFAQSVISLLTNPGRRQQLGNAARTLVQKNYSWTRVAEDFASALQGVVLRTPTAQPG